MKPVCTRPENILGNLDTATDSGAYILGVLWALCSKGEDGFWIRHKDPWYAQTIKACFAFDMATQTISARTGQQYRLKISHRSDVALIRSILEPRGWAPRNAEQRPYPFGPIDDRGFVRAWVETHSNADIAVLGRQRKESPRLRVYGNWDLLAEIGAVIGTGSGVGPRKLQRTSNETTKALYYTGGPYAQVVEWLYKDCDLSNPEARFKLQKLLPHGRTFLSPG